MTTMQAGEAIEAFRSVRPLATPENNTPGVLQTAGLAHLEAIHGLVSESPAEGHLLPRTRENIGSRIHCFLVALKAECVVALAEPAPCTRIRRGGQRAVVRSHEHGASCSLPQAALHV